MATEKELLPVNIAGHAIDYTKVSGLPEPMRRYAPEPATDWQSASPIIEKEFDSFQHDEL